MEIEKKFRSNYLTTKHYSYGVILSFLFLGACIFLSQFYWDKTFELSHLLAGNGLLVFQEKEWWRLISSIFVHGDMKHLLSNSLMLFFLSYFVSSFFGGKTLSFLFLVGGVLTNLVCLYFYPPNVFLVGASGVVYLLWGFWLVLFFGIETRYSFVERLMRVIGVFLILLVPTSYEPSTSYMAHSVGFFIGIGFGIPYYFYKRRLFKSFENWDFKFVFDDEVDFLYNVEDKGIE